jgi:small subunit ribosomal protein S17
MVKKTERTEKAAAKPAKNTESTSQECTDKFCPVHGTAKLHGRSLVGTVISAKAHKTATIERMRLHYITKYERYEKRRTKLLVHNPPCINAKLGDDVKIMESRPISKTKHFIITEVTKRK